MIGYGTPIARLAAASTETATSREIRTSSTPCTQLSRLEADHPAGLVLGHLAALEQQVDVAEHLAEREERLRDGDVAPQRLRDLVRGQRLARRAARGSCARGARASRSARRSAPRGRRTARRGRAAPARPPSRASRAARPCRSAARAGGRRPARPTCRRAGARSAGWRRCGGSGGRRPAASRRPRRRRPCPTGSARAGGAPRSVRPANSSASPSASRRVTVASSRPSRGTSATPRAAR